jgi:patatin-like phospholipase/acyl hydrolase
MPIRIIAVDGGGVKGAIPARMIQLLAGAHPGLLEKADLFAGTSTGGLIALGLAGGLAPDEVVEMYRRDARTSSARRRGGGPSSGTTRRSTAATDSGR